MLFVDCLNHPITVHTDCKKGQIMDRCYFLDLTSSTSLDMGWRPAGALQFKRAMLTLSRVGEDLVLAAGGRRCDKEADCGGLDRLLGTLVEVFKIRKGGELEFKKVWEIQHSGIVIVTYCT